MSDILFQYLSDHHQEREDKDEKAESRKVTLLQELDNKMDDMLYL